MVMKLKACSISPRVGWMVVLAVLTSFSAYADPLQPTSAAPFVRHADQDYIDYQLRAGEDPSKVAQMFGVTVEQLLSLNHVSDPRRLAVGATLKIPDPRATSLQQLRVEKDALAEQLATVQAGSSASQKTIDQLQAQVADLQDANGALRSGQIRYNTWRAAGIVSAGAAVVLALGLLIVWAKARDEERRRHTAAKEAEVMRAAVEKYRQLSAQFELKYQSLFHQAGLPAPAQSRADALRNAYDEDRARLDAIVSEAEHEIKSVVAQQSSDNGHGKAPALRLSPARKSG